ncbi:helix-turn-helix transcriptional regulator [Streptomyces sp. NPDC002386]
MPQREEPPPTSANEGEPTLLNMSQLAEALGVSRQALHAWRRAHDDFPQPQRRKGSTRDEWNVDEVRAYWQRRDTRPGHRTDLAGDDQ